MASSDNLPAFEPWMFRSSSTIADSWSFPDAFARETESALTKALQQSFTNHHHQNDVVSPISPSFFVKPSEYCSTTASASTVTVSGSGSGSDPETPGSKRRGSNLGVKTAKRKSRASKRSMTTFIQADPANFRQMVQEVTGVKFDGIGHPPVSTVVKPEPHRQPFINRLQGLLPTLDTSAYLLEHHDNNNSSNRQMAVSGGFSQAPATIPVAGGVDFDSFCNFPTLESWN